MADWYIVDGNLPYLTEFPTLYEIDDYPGGVWRIEDGELPYRLMFPTMESIDDAPDGVWKIIDGDLPFRVMFPEMHPIMIEHADAVEQDEYVTVYPLDTQQDEFGDNGICVLMPAKCEITEALNAEYELLLEHPIDDAGRWRYLTELNIIKANGQLFRIYSKESKLNQDGTMSRIVKARHIFYDLNDRLLVDVRPENKNGSDFIAWIMQRTYESDPLHQYTEYQFSYSSDIEETATSYFQGVSVTAALLGADNSFINRLGGELYRDNFRFSINQSRETSQADGFDIRYGADMLEVDEIIDYSSFVTLLIAKDNFGHSITLTLSEPLRMAHHVAKMVTFSYNDEEEAEHFEEDARGYFADRCYPQFAYKVRFAELKNLEEYKEFIGLQECNIGDAGNIYCESLDISTQQKIVRKTYDVLTKETVSIELGNLANSITRQERYDNIINANTAADKAAEAAQKEAEKALIGAIHTWGDAKAYRWKDLKPFTWYQLKKGLEE